MSMVKMTDEHSVVDIGAAADVVVVLPGFGMMTFTPRRWPIAAGPDTAAVAGRQRTVLCRGEQSAGLAVAENLPLSAFQRGDHVAVAEKLSHDRCGHGFGDAVDPAGSGAVDDVVEVGVDVDRGSGPVD